jgi:hypothetical protein
MKRTLFLLPAFLFAVNSIAQLNSYTFKRPLNKAAKEDYYAIPLTPELVARCKNDLSDIRLYQITTDTTEVPYLIDWMGNKTKEEAVAFELINDTYNEKCCSYVTLKFNKKQTINRIKLDVTEHNFDKSLMVEGSNDGKQWFTIRERMRIVRFQNASENFSYTTLDFQDTEFTYFRIKFDDDGSPRVTVSGAYAFENVATKGQYTELKTGERQQTENKKEKTSEIIVSFPYNYVISHINLRSDNKKDFYRNINIYSSAGTYHTAKGEMDSWQMIGSGVLSTNGTNFYQLYHTQTKKLKIEVINYDDQPVTINEIKAYAENTQLVAALPADGVIFVAYGKENDNAPVYDLVHFKEKIPASLSQIGYGDEQIKTITISKASPLIESKTWLWVVMGAVILIIGYFALSMLKKEQQN